MANDLSSLLTNNFTGAPQLMQPGSPAMSSAVMSNNPIMGMFAGQEAQDTQDTLMQNFTGNRQAQESAALDLAQKQANVPLMDAQRQLAMSQTGVQQGLYDSGQMKQAASAEVQAKYKASLLQADQSELGSHLVKATGWNELAIAEKAGATDEHLREIAKAAKIDLPDGPIDHAKIMRQGAIAVQALPITQDVYKKSSELSQLHEQLVGKEAARAGIGAQPQQAQFAQELEQIKLKYMLAQLQYSQPPDRQAVNGIEMAIKARQPISTADVATYIQAKGNMLPPIQQKEIEDAGSGARVQWLAANTAEARLRLVKEAGMDPKGWNGDLNSKDAINLVDYQGRVQQQKTEELAYRAAAPVLKDAQIQSKTADGNTITIPFSQLDKKALFGPNFVEPPGSATPHLSDLATKKTAPSTVTPMTGTSKSTGRRFNLDANGKPISEILPQASPAAIARGTS